MMNFTGNWKYRKSKVKSFEQRRSQVARMHQLSHSILPPSSPPHSKPSIEECNDKLEFDEIDRQVFALMDTRKDSFTPCAKVNHENPNTFLSTLLSSDYQETFGFEEGSAEVTMMGNDLKGGHSSFGKISKHGLSPTPSSPPWSIKNLTESIPPKELEIRSLWEKVTEHEDRIEKLSKCIITLSDRIQRLTASERKRIDGGEEGIVGMMMRLAAVVFHLVFFSMCSALSINKLTVKEGKLARNGAVGKASYYTEWNSNPGSCGYIPSFDNLVALSPEYMPAACGKCIIVNHGGVQEKAIVTDTCMGCDSGHIDMSDNMFSRFDDLAKGIIAVDWEFIECNQ